VPDPIYIRPKWRWGRFREWEAKKRQDQEARGTARQGATPSLPVTPDAINESKTGEEGDRPEKGKNLGRIQRSWESRKERRKGEAMENGVTQNAGQKIAKPA